MEKNTLINPKNIKAILCNYVNCKLSGLKENYDINVMMEDSYENFLILIKPNDIIYKNQIHILQFSTVYKESTKVKHFPFDKPKVTFLTPIYHSNVSPDSGYICLDVLNSQWTAKSSFLNVIQSILLFLDEPNPSSPLNSQAAHLYDKCQKLYHSSKNKKMSIEELEKIKLKCFDDYISIANDRYNESCNKILKRYYTQFPYLIDNEYKFDEDAFKLQYKNYLPKELKEIAKNEVTDDDKNEATKDKVTNEETTKNEVTKDGDVNQNTEVTSDTPKKVFKPKWLLFKK